MNKALAYLISVGIVGFGGWTIRALSGYGLTWFLGFFPLAVGLLSLAREIQNLPKSSTARGGQTGP